MAKERNPISNQGLSNVRLIERLDSAYSLQRSQIHQPLNIFKSVSLAGFDKAVIEVLSGRWCYHSSVPEMHTEVATRIQAALFSNDREIVRGALLGSYDWIGYSIKTGLPKQPQYFLINSSASFTIPAPVTFEATCMDSAITAVRAAKQIIKTLKAAGNADRAAQSRVYFKDYEDVRFYGLAVPEARAVEREFFASVKGVWTMEDALALCDLLIRERQLEAKQIGIEVLARFKRQFNPALLPTIKDWLAGNHCSNWATTDALCSVVIAPLVQKHPELITELKRWTREENLWVRRASAVPLVGFARRGQHLDDAYEIAEALFGYPEDLIHKATGWLLRDAGKTDAARLEAFLLRHGPRIPRTALRYAIEKSSPEKRQLLLAKTKAQS